MGHTSNLNLSWDKRGIRARGPIFPGFDQEREEKKERGDPRLPSKIFEVPLVGFRRAKKVHRIDEGYAWVLGKRDFAEDPRGEILGN